MSNQLKQPGEPHSFNLTEVEAAIAETLFAGHLHHLTTTPSTNEVAAKAALAGARIGVWIADQQLAGRGRGRNTWHSPAGSGLYMTALVAPPVPMQAALSLSLRVAIAAQSAIASVFGFQRPSQIDIRWPNDLMLARKDGPARKVGGILIDTASNPASATRPATLRYAVIGIGINVNQTSFPPELDAIATSLRREFSDPSQPFRREPLAAAILIALDAELRALATDNLQPATCNLSLYSTWLTGKRVRVEARDGVPSYTGTTAGLNPQGFLLVAGDDGQIHTVLSGGLREP
jgi:BirA family biotin operon repressor/biotin-[acetyl-CoA-carboxylase] ligase